MCSSSLTQRRPQHSSDPQAAPAAVSTTTTSTLHCNATHDESCTAKTHQIKKESNTFETNRTSALLLLAICATGICSCYLYYGLLQERLFSGEDSVVHVVGPISTFVLLMQTVTNFTVAALWNLTEKRLFRGVKSQVEVGKIGRLNQRLLVLTSFSYFAAMTASNESLHHVSYPTAVLAKSSKLIPTMAVGLLVERKAYTIREWLGAGLITTGIIIFNLSRMSSSSSASDNQRTDSPYGLFLLLFSLAMDGVLGSCQSLLKNDTKGRGSSNDIHRPPSAIETMLYTNLYATVFLIPLSLYSGQFSNGMRLLSMGDVSVAKNIGLLNLISACGQIFIFFTIHFFSPLMCTTITTTRKFFTILLSVVKFGHVFTGVQWSCILMVFTGIYMGIVSKVMKGQGGSGGGVNIGVIRAKFHCLSDTKKLA